MTAAKPITDDKFTRLVAGIPIPTPSPRSFGIFITIFAVMAGLLLAYLPGYRQALIKKERAAVESHVAPYGQALSATVFEKAGIVYGVTAFAKSNRDIPANSEMFNRFASGLIPRDKSIVTIGISPGGVILNIYPPSSKSLGLDLLHDRRPDVRRDVAKTIQARKAMIAGPVLHASGKTVMVIRDPIFNENGSFWGITNVAFDKELLIQGSGIDELDKTLDIGVKEQAGDNLDMDKTIFARDPVIVTVAVPGETWLIGARPKQGWEGAIKADYWSFAAGGLGLIFVLATLMTGAIDRQNILVRAVARRTAELAEKNDIISNTFNGTVNALASFAEHKDPYTVGHERHVVQIAMAVAEKMDMPKERREGLRIAAALHDVGKMYVPMEILSKPGKLSDLELSMIKVHPTYSHEVLKEIDFPWPVADIVLQHHERMDGSGYPQGLKGEDILLEARILAVADVIEAMASHRPYRSASTLNKALAEIKKNRGLLYDAAVVDATLAVFKQGFKLTER